MASTFKTPGVYVEEITKFPPSVAQVETAIPAFIGYTEKAILNGVTHYFKPVAVRSLIEYESIYGGAPPEAATVSLDDNNQVAKVAPEANFYLYDSLRMFYNNGGSKCYIVPVGPYRDNSGQITAKSLNHFKDGLAALEKEDEPTIILAPDATLLANNGLYDFQAAALAQCGKLMDRVTILDLKHSDESIIGDFDAKVQEFRDKVGIENLKYGAAYTPWLATSLIKQTRYRYLSLIRQNGGASVGLESLTSDTAIKSFILDKLQKSISLVDEIHSKINTLTGGVPLKTKFVDCRDAVESVFPSTNYADYEVPLKALYSFLRDIMTAFSSNTYRSGLPDIDGFRFKSGLEKIIRNNKWDEALQALMHHNNGFATASAVTFNILLPGGSAVADLKTEFDAITGSNINITYGSTNVSASITALYTAAGSDVEKIVQVAIDGANAAFGILEAALIQFADFAKQFELTFDKTLPEIFGTYKTILDEVNAQLTTLPPCGSIAGVYSSVDAEKGVWKAPANVSLRSVRNMTRRIDAFEQENLNVDVNAGKSINAIRAFSGKGIMVWGARTLAGNDNEWRYISVRRFCNMVEESVRKSTESFVFEPNDANTWVRVRAMIENFLTLQWRAGALAGAKPEDAFYVRVGLNQTMTALDILEGRMIVEIGMAVVRPAEFIILRFSHKMQES